MMKIIKNSMVFIPLLMLFFISCEEKTEVNVYVFTENYTVKPNDWNVGNDDESGPYFYYEFREPNLTQQIYDRGIMQAFIVLRNQNISPLPFDDFWYEDGYRWTEQVTCEFRPGYVTFILKYNDHAAEKAYYTYDFRVRFMW